MRKARPAGGENVYRCGMLLRINELPIAYSLAPNSEKASESIHLGWHLLTLAPVRTVN